MGAGPRLIEGATLDHARQIAPNLRLADRLEISRASGLGPLAALKRSLEASQTTFRVEHDGAPVVIGGSCPSPADPHLGIPWLLGTDFITHRGSWFLRNSPAIWSLAGRGYCLLFNLIDARNEAHVRWLEWSGCQFLETRHLNGHPFKEFSKVCAFH